MSISTCRFSASLVVLVRVCKCCRELEISVSAEVRLRVTRGGCARNDDATATEEACNSMAAGKRFV